MVKRIRKYTAKATPPIVLVGFCMTFIMMFVLLLTYNKQLILYLMQSYTEECIVVLGVLWALNFLVVVGRRVGSIDKDYINELHNERIALKAKIAQKPQPDVLDTIQLNLNQLNEYYSINKSQARNSFRFSVVTISCGLIAIIGGIVFYYIAPATKSIALTGISTVSGILLQFIGGTSLYVYGKSLDQLNLFFVQLEKMQDTMLAIRLCEKIEPAENRVELQEKLVVFILNRTIKVQPITHAKKGRKRSTKRDSEPQTNE